MAGTTMRAIEVHEYGGPEVLRLVELPAPTPGPGEVLIANQAWGINFVDTQHRQGEPYPDRALPFTPGIEAAGVVEALGRGVVGVAVGDRVLHDGHYVEYTVAAAHRLVGVPDGVSFELAVTVGTQGGTAHYLTHDAHPVLEGEWVLVHAAAGGVGRIVVAYAKELGGRVVGGTSDETKLGEVLATGADAAVNVTDPQYVRRVLDATGGGCHVVYDSLGGRFFEPNLHCLRERGDLVGYGLAAGRIPPFDPGRLSGHFDADLNGSLRVMWAAGSSFSPTRDVARARTNAVFADALAGVVPARVAGRFPLAEAADAHRLMATRPTGKVLMVR
jgi:NADPH2:quinone reductase